MRHKKIAIIGNAGSGKTTLAFALHKKLHLPVIHLDQYYWLPNWQRVDFEIFNAQHEKLCKTESWIMEGSFSKTFPTRLAHADVIIFIDLPRRICIWRILKRAISYYGKVIPGNPAQCKQNIFSFKFLEFLQWTWEHNKRHAPYIYQMLSELQKTKPVYILKSTQEIQEFLKENT